ncbi:MAG: hypothetical protein KGH67_01990 [Candidatus Micrarchaeota archaeon]|nr:hypothetical protein [Candidatus Micrarchaeota archaeon]MDE1859276.1 hypothetical protein [Candidatus Micrarchaeota archaeon]
MIDAIITSLDKDYLAATPNSDIDVNMLLGKKIQYIDKNDKIWPGIVTAVDEPFVIVRFDDFPTGLGQGQMIQILDAES